MENLTVTLRVTSGEPLRDVLAAVACSLPNGVSLASLPGCVDALANDEEAEQASPYSASYDKKFAYAYGVSIN